MLRACSQVDTAACKPPHLLPLAFQPHTLVPPIPRLDELRAPYPNPGGLGTFFFANVLRTFAALRQVFPVSQGPAGAKHGAGVIFAVNVADRNLAIVAAAARQVALDGRFTDKRHRDLAGVFAARDAGVAPSAALAFFECIDSVNTNFRSGFEEFERISVDHSNLARDGLSGGQSGYASRQETNEQDRSSAPKRAQTMPQYFHLAPPSSSFSIVRVADSLTI